MVLLLLLQVLLLGVEVGAGEEVAGLPREQSH